MFGRKRDTPQEVFDTQPNAGIAAVLEALETPQSRWSKADRIAWLHEAAIRLRDAPDPQCVIDRQELHDAAQRQFDEAMRRVCGEQ